MFGLFLNLCGFVFICGDSFEKTGATLSAKPLSATGNPCELLSILVF